MATTRPVTALPGAPSVGGRRRADVELRIPADGAFASVLRTTAAGLAARLDFTIEDIEDLRIAVGEAHALALDHASPAGDLTCGFELAPGQITVVVSAPVEAAPALDRDSFAWQVLTTLATSADLQVDEGVLSVSMTLSSSAPTSPTTSPGPTGEEDADDGPHAG